MIYKLGDVVKIKASAFKPEGEAYRCAKLGHPFVLLGIKDNKFIACISSSNNDKVNKKFPYNIPLDDAEYAGYYKSTTHIKVDKQTIPISEEDIIEKIGHVSDSDYIKLLKKYNIVPKDKIIKLEDLKTIKENINLFELLLQNNTN